MTERSAPPVSYGLVASPLGPILAARSTRGLIRLNFTKGTAPRAPESNWKRDDDALAGEAALLAEYFRGTRRTFDGLRFFADGTDFERRVWNVLVRIPYGETLTYGQIAGRIHQPGAARAVGRAVGKNPLPIVIPCHRVIASRGRLGGFTGGLAIKKRLLALEGVRGIEGLEPLFDGQQPRPTPAT